MSKPAAQFEPLAVAVLTVSDTRTPDNDTSGDLLVQRLEEAGHHLQARQIVKDADMFLRISAAFHTECCLNQSSI